ncbi:hypothetical protein PNIG_a2305 [Pseudoalteromonas nigrifaciens]|uniref:Uncharacterized protein n=2 Tax=Pseudoalteromonas TaxID=53246 RepID=A0AAC9UKA8_9GAMM|nr:hypothetical protein [Pseudoalteromonas nigrifaciens]ASM54337.1 hypothetical protein PNIG_a2305 [Pseudoalteromonas nigrifaciens]MBE0420680.1 hypothetical protein [Pseudoalteromonas nigrifaciens]GEN43785.1 hypothetical protein PNI02_32510 [Pseudoalteromonas nigrifaciens]SUC51839.1 Uncharacterised protein [Pseudoalteromonas nigrifaciens]
MRFILSINKIINVLFLIFLSVILLNDLWFHKLPELFDGGERLLNSVYNLAMGYLVSYVFYLIVVRYKEYKDEVHINSVILPLVNEVIKSNELINECLRDTDKSETLNLSDIESLKKFLKQNKLNDNIPRATGTFLYTPATWADFLEGQKQLSRKNIQRAFSFISHLDPELIRLLTKLDNSHYYNLLVFISKFSDVQKKSDMENLAESYFEYNKSVVELKNYKHTCLVS